MKKVLQETLSDREIIEAKHIRRNGERESALMFMQKFFNGKTRKLLEGRGNAMIEVPGLDTKTINGNLPGKKN